MFTRLGERASLVASLDLHGRNRDTGHRHHRAKAVELLCEFLRDSLRQEEDGLFNPDDACPANEGNGPVLGRILWAEDQVGDTRRGRTVCHRHIV
jgi:hypothetical protein